MLYLPTGYGTESLCHREVIYLFAMNEASLAAVVADVIEHGAISLDISTRGRVELPPQIGSLVPLRSLDIGGNRLTSLPPEIGRLVNLEDLYARENYIASLPAEIGNLKALRNLWLGGNKLHTLPLTIGRLENLQELYIYENHLEILPKSIASLSSLSELDVSHNYLRVLPREIAQLKRLMLLKVSGNAIETVAEEIMHLPLLTEKSLRELNSILAHRNLRTTYASCFISYSVQDSDFVDHLFRDLRSSGVQCWYAPEHLKIGARTRPTLQDAIHKHDRLLLVISEKSMKSFWVEDEVERALQIERKELRPMLFPIRIDNSILSAELGYDKSLTRLLRDLEQVDDVQHRVDQQLDTPK